MIFRSITSRLILSYCLLLVLLGAGFLFVSVLSFNHYARESLTNTLSARAQDIWNVAEGALDQPSQLNEVVQRRFSPESQNRYIRIRLGKDVRYQSGLPANGAFSPDDVPFPPTPNTSGKSVLYGNLLVHAREFKDHNGTVISVDSGQSFIFARAMQEQLAMTLLIGLPILLLLAAIAGYELMRRALRPVEVMIHAAELYSFNDPHKRIPLVGSEPRFEALGLALNRMLDRLDKAYSHIKRFSADAAHELRTPLTIIRGELELIGSGARPPSEIDHAISNALGEMTRLSGIVNSLITLSRMDSGSAKQAHEPVDLQALALEVIDQMNLLADDKQIKLYPPNGSAVIVSGDRDRLKQVLVNLLDNAIKYTPRRGVVSFETGKMGDMGFVVIEDNGIGIDSIHHHRVFDRFYRVSTDRGEMGAGLGLAIVKSICIAHEGTVSLRSGPQIGSSFRIEIPLMLGTVCRSLAVANNVAQFSSP